MLSVCAFLKRRKQTGLRFMLAFLCTQGVMNANEGYIQQLNQLRQMVRWDMVILTTTQHSSNHSSFVSNNPESRHGHAIRSVSNHSEAASVLMQKIFCL
jgi:hypothetical protein